MLLRLSIIFCIGCAVAGVLVAGCGDDGGAKGSADVSVVATTTQLADMATNVAGDRGDVVGLLAVNSDPHDYEPRPSDAEAMIDADLVLQSGGDLDAWVDDLVESSETDAEVIELLAAVRTIEGGHEHGDEEHADEAHGEGGHDEDADPHWWQDPANAVSAVEEIRDRLSEVDPEGSDAYAAGAAAYVAEIEALDSAIADCLGAIPASQRKLVTSHDAMGYFADRYEIEVVGAAVPALTTQAQPSAGETAELVDLIEAEGVPAVFPEAGLNADLEQAIADEAGAVVGGELYADTLGDEGSGAETYLGAMAANAAALAGGFSGGTAECALPA